MMGIDPKAIYANDAGTLRTWYADLIDLEILFSDFLNTANGTNLC